MSVSVVCVCVVPPGFRGIILVARVGGSWPVLVGCGLCALVCPPPAALHPAPTTGTSPLLHQACYRTEGVNYRKKCAAVVAQYEAVHRAPGAPPASAAAEEE